MEDAIRNIAGQFSWQPVIENPVNLPETEKFLVSGMGGSHLAADLIHIWDPGLDLIVQWNYGLPQLTDEQWRDRLVIASSYSGNTEEAVSTFDAAIENGLPVAAVSTGGTLIERAQEHGAPFVQLPDTGIQPRSALGFALRGLLKLMGRAEDLRDSSALADTLDPAALQEQGMQLAETLQGAIPVIYSSTRNKPIAYNWKIKFNETGKIPAFYNVFPELNHNEMTGFDDVERIGELAKTFHFVFLEDDRDMDRVRTRMKVLGEQLEERDLPVTRVRLEGDNIFYRIFHNLTIADWAALHTANLYGLDAEHVPMIEDFKQRIAE